MAILQYGQTNLKNNFNTLQMNMIDEPNINALKAKHIILATTNLIEKDVPNSKSQMERKRV